MPCFEKLSCLTQHSESKFNFSASIYIYTYKYIYIYIKSPENSLTKIVIINLFINQVFLQGKTLPDLILA